MEAEERRRGGGEWREWRRRGRCAGKSGRVGEWGVRRRVRRPHCPSQPILKEA
ncbi:MAG: hypothetical protein ACKERG_03770 [Candidatus Hodgkinia cicadicola]